MRIRGTWAAAAFFLWAPSQGAWAAGAPEPPEDAVVAVLPFVPGDPTRVMVDLAPEGQKPFVMLLDTGASDSVVTPRMARELGVRVRRAKTTPYRRSTSLGRDLQFWVDVASSDTASKTGWEYGLLGGEFLDDYVLELDYPAQRVRFLDPKKYRVPEVVEAADERVVRFKRSGTRVFTEIEVAGETTRVLLDTGAPDTVVLSGRAARELGLDLENLKSFGEVGTVMGPMEVFLLETEGFRWAGYDFDTTPMLVAPKGWYNQAGANDSALGYDILRQFVIRIDYKRKRLWLKRSGDRRVTFGGADWAAVKELGAMLAPVAPAQYWVWQVDPEGKAAAFGLRAGDFVVDQRAEGLEDLKGLIEAGKSIKVMRLDEEGIETVFDVGPRQP